MFLKNKLEKYIKSRVKMPNWCYCNVSVNCKDDDAIELFKNILYEYEDREGVLNFNKIIPVSDDSDISTRVEKWGTSGYGFFVELHYDDDKYDEVTLSIACKWRPCNKIIQKLSEIHSNYEFLLQYTEEQGPNGFCGYDVYKNGVEIISDYFQDYEFETENDVQISEKIFPIPNCKPISWDQSMTEYEIKYKEKFESLRSIGNSLEMKYGIPFDIFNHNILHYLVDFLYVPRDMRPASIDQRIIGYDDFKEEYRYLYESEEDDEDEDDD